MYACSACGVWYAAAVAVVFVLLLQWCLCCCCSGVHAGVLVDGCIYQLGGCNSA